MNAQNIVWFLLCIMVSEIFSRNLVAEKLGRVLLDVRQAIIKAYS